MKRELSVSVVIPVLGDRETLTGMLDTMRSTKSVPHEVLVIDSGNEGSCAAIAMQAG